MSSIVVAGDTSGSITIAAPAVAGSGTLTLPVATDTLIGKATTDTLTNKSIAATQLTGTIAAARLPAGSVLQVVNGTYATLVSNATSTYITTGLTASITPSSTSSKIMIFANMVGVGKNSNTASNSVSLRLYRGASSIIGFEDIGGYTATSLQNYVGTCATTYLDSPATTAATTYTVYFASPVNAATVYVQNYYNAQANATSTITLMEIAG
jgi:hypothetical protein